MNRHHLNKEYCKGCLICVEVCPTNAIRASVKINAKGYVLPTVDDMSRCTGCKLCEIVCPDFATSIEVIREVNKSEEIERDGKKS